MTQERNGRDLAVELGRRLVEVGEGSAYLVGDTHCHERDERYMGGHVDQKGESERREAGQVMRAFGHDFLALIMLPNHTTRAMMPTTIVY